MRKPDLDKDRQRKSIKKKIEGLVWVFCAFFPAVLLVPIWSCLNNWIGIEGAAGLVVIIQMISIVMWRERLTDAIVRWWVD